MLGEGGAGIGREASIKATMRSATPTLTIPDSAFSFSFMPSGGGGWSNGIGGPGDISRLTVVYDWGFMTPLIRPFFTNGQLRLTVQSTMKNEAKFD
jgi:hypothetical protein